MRPILAVESSIDVRSACSELPAETWLNVAYRLTRRAVPVANRPSARPDAAMDEWLVEVKPQAGAGTGVSAATTHCNGLVTNANHVVDSAVSKRVRSHS